MIDPATLLQGTEGDALCALKHLREKRESRSIELSPHPSGGTQAVVQHLMDGWGLWLASTATPNGDTMFRRVKYALSREGLFDDR